MDTAVIERAFNRMGARVKISEPHGRWVAPRPFSIDIRRDSDGEFFDIQVKNEIEMLVLDVDKADRHLLMMTRNAEAAPGKKDEDKGKYLCGHDERNWFTCAVPGATRIAVSTVSQAKEALKPAELRTIERTEGLARKKAHKRHRKLESGRKIHRQGEFMFIPEPHFQPPQGSLVVIHRNEPMRRGGVAGNAHMAQYLYRHGGEAVYVGPAGKVISVGAFQSLIKRDPKDARFWRLMRADAMAFVKGKITHREHKTLDLGETWHRVVLNRESEAPGARSVRFID